MHSGPGHPDSFHPNLRELLDARVRIVRVGHRRFLCELLARRVCADQGKGSGTGSVQYNAMAQAQLLGERNGHGSINCHAEKAVPGLWENIHPRTGRLHVGECMRLLAVIGVEFLNINIFTGDEKDLLHDYDV